MANEGVLRGLTLAMTIQNATGHFGGGDAGIVRNGLIIWYDGLNNTGDGHSGDTSEWFDLSGNGNHGTIYNGIWGNNELVFNGTSTWVNCGRRDFRAVTIECLVTFTGSPEIADVANNYHTGGYGWMRHGNGQLMFQVYRSGAYQQLFAGAIEVGTPNLVAGVANSTKQAVYRDGRFVDGAGSETPISPTTQSTVFALGVNPIGSTHDNPAYWFNGSIKSFRLYDRVLTSEEIAQNYRYDKRRFGL